MSLLNGIRNEVSPLPSRLTSIAFATGIEIMCLLLEVSTAKHDLYEDDSQVLMLLHSQAAARMGRMYLPSHGLVHYLQPVQFSYGLNAVLQALLRVSVNVPNQEITVKCR